MFASSITEPFLLLIVFSLRRSHFVALGRFSMDPSLDPLCRSAGESIAGSDDSGTANRFRALGFDGSVEDEPEFDCKSVPDSNDSAAVNHYHAESFDPDENLFVEAKVMQKTSMNLDTRDSTAQASDAGGAQLPLVPMPKPKNLPFVPMTEVHSRPVRAYFITPTGHCVHSARHEVRKQYVKVCEECIPNGIQATTLPTLLLDWSDRLHGSFRCERFHKRDDGPFYGQNRRLLLAVTAFEVNMQNLAMRSWIFTVDIFLRSIRPCRFVSF